MKNFLHVSGIFQIKREIEPKYTLSEQSIPSASQLTMELSQVPKRINAVHKQNITSTAKAAARARVQLPNQLNNQGLMTILQSTTQ